MVGRCSPDRLRTRPYLQSKPRANFLLNRPGKLADTEAVTDKETGRQGETSETVRRITLSPAVFVSLSDLLCPKINKYSRGKLRLSYGGASKSPAPTGGVKLCLYTSLHRRPSPWSACPKCAPLQTEAWKVTAFFANHGTPPNGQTKR